MNKLTKTRFIILSLVFSILYLSCRHHKSGEELYFHFEGSKAVALVIPKKLVNGVDNDKLQVFLSSSNAPMLGKFNEEDEKILFHPLIPFTHGLTYKVIANGNKIGEIEVPVDIAVAAPNVVAVYPTVDTVPENLLKLYIEFSRPMQEGESLKKIALIKNGNDTLQNVFLDLQPELWNNDRTILTIWLDPGRIKRDLQPNLAMGPPLIKGNKYTLMISKEWKDQDGVELQQSFLMDFVTTDRDSLSPDVLDWTIKLPRAGTKDVVTIDFNESLDYMVAKNSIRIVNNLEQHVPGTISMHPGERGLSFSPDTAWKKEDYYLVVEAKLEDHAGNNLERLFDNDITKKKEDVKGVIRRKRLQMR